MDTSEKVDKDTNDNGHNDSANWKWGIFYYNPKDNRLLPPKRYGLGWTINFANMDSAIAFILVLTLIILFSLWLKAQAM
jgi:uncharacterized membrane protein